MIDVNNKIPYFDFIYFDENYNTKTYDTEYIFSKEKIVLFGMPGAFTEKCSDNHLPSILANYTKFKKNNIDDIYCLLPNDYMTIKEWLKNYNAENKIKVLPDPDSIFIRKLGLGRDLKHLNMGLRTVRFAMYIEDKIVKKILLDIPKNINDDPYFNTSGYKMLKEIKS